MNNNPLKILDVYILKKYLSTFGFVVLIFTLISCVIDFSEKVESFIREPITKKEIWIDYYLNFIPHINTLLFPIYALISVIFFTSRMAYNSEIISILNAGVSFMRLMRPYLIGACMIAGLHLWMNHFIVPNGNKKRLAVEHKYVWKFNDRAKTDNVHMFLDPSTKIFLANYRRQDTSARDLRIEHFDNGKLTSVTKADFGYWRGYPNKWHLENVQTRHFNGINETLVRLPVLDTTMNLTPDDFVRFLNQKEMLTTPELLTEIDKLEKRGIGNTKEYQMEVYRRTSDPVSIIILSLIGMALAARKVRGGIGLHLALGIGLGAVFIFLSKFSVTIAMQPGVSAWVGVWLPNIIFGIVSLILIARAQK